MSLQYDRDLILDGQFWRLITSHLVHFSFYHFAMNVLGFALCCLVVYRVQPAWVFVFSLLGFCFGISILLLWAAPKLEIYRGFSGVLYGMFVLAVFSLQKEAISGPKKLTVFGISLDALVLAGFLLGKLIMENRPDYDKDYLKEYILVPVATEAHLAGASMGLVFALFIFRVEIINYFKK